MLASISVGTSRKGGGVAGETKSPVVADMPKPYPKKRAAQISQELPQEIEPRSAHPYTHLISVWGTRDKERAKDAKTPRTPSKK
jgi:hypothetical protein